jgi:hypothetical protein
MEQDLNDQVKIVIRLLREKAKLSAPLHRSSPIFQRALEWIRIAPGKVDPALRAELIEAMADAFRVGQKEVLEALEGVAPTSISHSQATTQATTIHNEEEELEALLPKGGWFENYIEYTRYTESPLSYHLVCSLVTLGCSLGRRCWVDQGHYKLFAPLNAMLIGPTGVVHKSSAVDVAKNLIRETSLCPIMADKITAEKMITALVESPQQFIYAPELSVFFGRQRYNEGLANLILRLLDYPPEWVGDTISRSVETITEPTISILGGSTMSLLNTSSADVVMSGGFLNRFLTVVEIASSRVFPRPRKGRGEQVLLKCLAWMKHFSGEVKMSEAADLFYTRWYYKWRHRQSEDTSLAEITQRSADHLIRIAMLIHVIECNTLIICEPCIKIAASLLAHIERRAPTLAKAMIASSQVTFSDYVLERLGGLGGTADHSTLLRRCSSKMNATQFKAAMQTLNESGLVRIVKKGIAHHYVVVVVATTPTAQTEVEVIREVKKQCQS